MFCPLKCLWRAVVVSKILTNVIILARKKLSIFLPCLSGLRCHPAAIESLDVLQVTFGPGGLQVYRTQSVRHRCSVRREEEEEEEGGEFSTTCRISVA